MVGKGLFVVLGTLEESTELIITTDAFAFHFGIEFGCFCWDHAAFTLLRFKVEFRAFALVDCALAQAFNQVEIVVFIALQTFSGGFLPDFTATV